RGTHVGTMRVAEENKEWPALNICLGNLRTVLVHQLERSTDRRSAFPATSKVPGGVKKNTCEYYQAGHKGRQDQQNLGCSRCHKVQAGIRSMRPSRRAPFRKIPQCRNRPKV